MRCRGGGDAMASKKLIAVKKHIIKNDPDFCKHLADPFVVDLKECNYSTKKCKAGRALVQWNVELQKPVGLTARRLKAGALPVGLAARRQMLWVLSRLPLLLRRPDPPKLNPLTLQVSQLWH